MDKGNYICIECGKEFTIRRSWLAHRARHERHRRGLRFQCEVCGLIFLDKSNVEYHTRKVHLNDFQYYCEQCGRAFVCKSHLNRHVKEAHEEQKPTLFCCKYKGCNASFRARTTFRYHLKKHEGKNYNCNFCEQIFFHPDRLRIHVKKHHGTPKKLLQCKFCDMQVTTKESLKNHMRTHTGEKPFICEQCGQNFTTNQQLKTHIVVHTKEKPFPCTICDKRFTQRGSLGAHFRAVHAKTKIKAYFRQNWVGLKCEYGNLFAAKMEHPLLIKEISSICQVTMSSDQSEARSPVIKKEQVRFSCSGCEKSFDKKDTLRSHVNRVHKRIGATTCKECGKTFTAEWSFKKHFMKFHQGIVDNFKCDICGGNYTNKSSLQFHKNTNHLKKFNFFCDICGKGFFYQSTLKRHNQDSHNNGVPCLPCTAEGCGKIFASTSGLKYHIRAEHTSDKPTLVCEECGKIFDHPYRYNKHIRRHKNGRPRHKCSICQKVLASKDSLYAHIRIHTGEKPFVCEQCGIGFTKKGGLRVHMVVHTKEKPHVCKYCGKKYTQRSPLIRHIQLNHPELADQARQLKDDGI